MKKVILFLSLIAMVVILDSCAGACQRIKANGSLIGSIKGDWIVEKQSGGVITDVYLLENVMVASEQGSDGWLFLDQDGNPVNIGGDMKAIRVTSNKQEMFSKYIEYHMEFDTLTYQQRWAEAQLNPIPSRTKRRL
jgi:hypothetical protein